MLDPQLTAKLIDVLDRLEPLLPPKFEWIDWADTLAAQYHRVGQAGGLVALKPDLNQRFDDLLAMAEQQKRLRANTQLFLAGGPSNHVLLWGARGTGKSSLVRAMLGEYHSQGLRLIEVSKQDLGVLPRILAPLADLPYHFVVFCDDLSFEQGEYGYQGLKTALEGSMAQMPQRLMVIATSNRRHLVPELESDNQGGVWKDGELHMADAVNERISLADRFGLCLSFYAYNANDYLAICRHAYQTVGAQLAEQMDKRLPPWTDQLAIEAARFATEKGGRGGRVAHQFARDAAARALYLADF